MNKIDELRAKLRAAQERDATVPDKASARPDAAPAGPQLPRGFGPRCVAGPGWYDADRFIVRNRR